MGLPHKDPIHFFNGYKKGQAISGLAFPLPQCRIRIGTSSIEPASLLSVKE